MALTGQTCTLFQRFDDAGDMLRVCTNVRTTEGARAIGTYIPHTNPDGRPNPVVETVLRGETYRGRAFVVNAWYVTAYEPIYDARRKIVGILYVGVPQENVASLRKAVTDIRVAQSGRAFVVDSKGTCVISREDNENGKNLLDVKDAAGSPVMAELCKKALGLRDRQIEETRWLRQDPEESSASKKVVRYMYFKPWDWVVATYVPEQEVMQAQQAVAQANENSLWQLGWIGGATALLAVVLAWWLGQMIVGPVRAVALGLEAVAAGDLTVHLEAHPHDEVGRIEAGLNHAVAALREGQAEQKRQAERERDHAEELKDKIGAILAVVTAAAQGDLTQEVAIAGNDVVGQMGSGLGELLDHLCSSVRRIGVEANTLAHASEQLSGVSVRMNSDAQETASQATVVSAASEQVSRNVQTVATGVEEMSASIKEIAKSASDAARVASEAVKVAESTNSTIAKLGGSSQEIGKVIKVITAIAKQTNLLALNATIEAARAGEAGKGFAVVANEVKELAKETAQATEDISQQIEGIQCDTTGAVDAIRQISGVIDQINDISGTIASAVEEQTATTNEISRNVAEAARGTGEIAQNIAMVARAAEGTTAGATETQEAAAGLSRMAGALRQLVGQFNYDRQGSRLPAADAAPPWENRESKEGALESGVVTSKTRGRTIQKIPV